MNQTITPTANRLLAALPANEYERIVPKLEKVDLKFNTKIFDRGELIEHVYFPINTVTTLLAVGPTDLTLEIGLVGPKASSGCRWSSAIKWHRTAPSHRPTAPR